jgi:hypothetical protein
MDIEAATLEQPTLQITALIIIDLIVTQQKRVRITALSTSTRAIFISIVFLRLY